MSPSRGTGDAALGEVAHPVKAAPAAIPAVLRKSLLSSLSMPMIPCCDVGKPYQRHCMR
jgi:hypothetical protein